MTPKPQTPQPPQPPQPPRTPRRTPTHDDGVEIVVGDIDLLRAIWAHDIAQHPNDPQWLRWRDEYITANQTGGYRTYLVVVHSQPVGQGTLAIDPTLPAMNHTPTLCDGQTRAYVTALRIHPAFEGRGYISALMTQLEADAQALGFTELAVGVGEGEARNRAIYAHWGYTRPVDTFQFDGETVLCYVKALPDSVN